MKHDPASPSPQPNRPEPSPDWDALARFAAGECTAGEAETIRVWLDSHPADREVIDALQSTTADLVPDVDVEAALIRVQQRMRGPVPSGLDMRPADKPFTHPGRGFAQSMGAQRWRVATGAQRWGGAALLAAGIAAIVAVALLRRHPDAEPMARVYQTAVGQRDSVLLADGSRIVLGPDSRLEVSAGYGGIGGTKTGSREVVLQGDALFTVRHDADRPFAVRVGNAVIQDVGTTFVVESDASDGTRVSVVAGSVRLRRVGSAEDSGVALATGDRGTVDLTGVARAERNVAVADDTAWTTGQLKFDGVPLSQLASELHRWYGVLVNVADSSLVDRHVTTTIEAGQPVDEVLRNIGLSLGAKVERHGNSATIRK